MVDYSTSYTNLQIHTFTQSFILTKGGRCLAELIPFCRCRNIIKHLAGTLFPQTSHLSFDNDLSIFSLGSSASSLVQLPLISHRASLSLAPSKLDSEDLD